MHKNKPVAVYMPINQEELELIDNARELNKQSRNSFVAAAAVKEAKKLLRTEKKKY